MRASSRRIWFLPALGLILWWGARLGIAGNVSFEMAIAFGSLVNFGLLLLIPFISDFQAQPDAHFAVRFKHNLRGAVVYACLAALSVGVFYHVVAADQTAFRKLEREQFIEQSLSDADAFAALQKTDPRLAAMDRATAKARALDSLRFQFDPRWHVTASLILLVATSACCSLFATLICGFLRS